MSAVHLVIRAALALSGFTTRGAADTVTLDYTVGGVHVLQRVTPGNDIVAVDLYLVGGVQQLTPATAGLEALALKAAQYGTARYPGAAARHALTRTGSEWVVDPETDWTMVGFRGVADQFDSSWVAFADRIVHPTLDSDAVALARERLIRESRLHGMSPEAVAWETADSLAFEGHPYALNPSGTEASLTHLTPDAVRRYVHDHFVTSRMLLVVVGNIPRARLEALVAATLGTLPPGQYAWAPPAEVPRHPSSLAMVSRISPTNYLVGYYTGPSVRSPDYAAFELATELLSARVSTAVRYRLSLSYAAGAPYQGRGISSGALYASTPQPSLVLGVMRQQLDSVRQDRLPSWVMRDFVKEFTLDHLMDQESNEAQAAALARAQLYFGDYRQADAQLDILRRVKPGDLPRVAKLYMHDFHFVYVGDTTHMRRDWVKGW
ncbi:MAG TPA: insulinase family protein [Gemmatimonadaceae bacterium]|nr:insulinase family protein [Gemmatimonadaceae bacterium]